MLDCAMRPELVSPNALPRGTLAKCYTFAAVSVIVEWRFSIRNRIASGPALRQVPCRFCRPEIRGEAPRQLVARN
jgi:hypothetical protein